MFCRWKKTSADQAEIAYALYTDPPLGRAGMTEAEVRKTGQPALISTMAMEDVSRAYEKGETKAFMKILVNRADPRCLAPWASGRRGHPLHPRCHVFEGSLHGAATGNAHSSNRVRVHPDDAVASYFRHRCLRIRPATGQEQLCTTSSPVC